MGRKVTAGVLGILGCAAISAQQAPFPTADEIGGHPFAIRDKWVIGGEGAWDYLTIDPVARQLFIPHQTRVNVVDIASGQSAGEITGFSNARSVVLDPSGQFGYVSDDATKASDAPHIPGLYVPTTDNGDIKIFDRRSLSIEAVISLGCSPRSMALLPDQSLLVAICSSPTAAPIDSHGQPRANKDQHPPRRAGGEQYPPTRVAVGDSRIAVIDTKSRAVLVYLEVPGDFHVAQAGRDDDVYVTVGAAERDPHSRHPDTRWNQSIARIDVLSFLEDARRDYENRLKEGQSVFAPLWSVDEAGRSTYVSFFPLDSGCPQPQGLAVDGRDSRLFVACDNQKLLVLDSDRGQMITDLTIGPGTDAIAWDENHSLIFTANGAGFGSLSVVLRHVTDTYSLIQNLPTMARARTLAVDPSTGLVYLVTDLHGGTFDGPPVNGIGNLKFAPIPGSFQVLVVGN